MDSEKKYCMVDITETLSRSVLVEVKEGEDCYDAIERAREAYRHSDIVLLPDDYVDTDFEVLEKTPYTMDDIVKLYGANAAEHFDCITIDRN